MNWMGVNKGVKSTRQPSKIHSEFPHLQKSSIDLTACYESYKIHWKQIQDIILKEEQEKYAERKSSTLDDVLTVVNHLQQVCNLTQIELRSESNDFSCLEYLFDHNLLDTLCSWTFLAKEYSYNLHTEQLKFYELLLSNGVYNPRKLLCCDSFVKPLLRLLSSFNNVCAPLDIEKRVVILISQLCSYFSQHCELVRLLFPINGSDDGKEDGISKKLDIFSLLVKFVHRDGLVGEQARDSLLLCMSLSRNNDDIARFITKESQLCSVLAASLNGLYSLLPRKLFSSNADWFRFNPDDVCELPELTNFTLHLEFCNAASQISHESIKSQLLEKIYKGFLLLVIEPALTQGSDEELIATTAYFELSLRSVTHPGLLHSFVEFILRKQADGCRVLDCLIQRVNDNSKMLSIMSLSALETLVELNCEDIMVELALKHLAPCTHLMNSQREHISTIDPHCKSAKQFLALSINTRLQKTDDESVDYAYYLQYARSKIVHCCKATSNWTYRYDGTDSLPDYENGGDHVSLPSADGGSSGYESFRTYNNRDVSENNGLDGVFGSPCGSDYEALPLEINFPSLNPSLGLDDTSNSVYNASPVRRRNDNIAYSVPSIGPFLGALFKRLEGILDDDVRVMLRLSAIISRLCAYPQPLLRSFFLDHTLVFQPSVKSSFQILSSLKQEIELRLSRNEQLNRSLVDCSNYLDDRVKTLNRNQPNSLPPYLTSPSFSRVDNKRRSLTKAFGALFKKNSVQDHVEPTGGGYRYVKSKSVSPDTNMATYAILFNEWMKELAALSQEQTVLQINAFPT